MQANIEEGSLFYSIEQFKSLVFDSQEIFESPLSQFMDSDSDSTSNTQRLGSKTQLKEQSPNNSKLEDQRFDDCKVSLVNNFTKKSTKEYQSMVNNTTSSKSIKNDPSVSQFAQRMKQMTQSNWSSNLQLRCVIEFNNKKIKTNCRIKDAQMLLQNGELTFRLAKIVKMKVMYQDYQKCICFTYDQTRGKKRSQLKFKIFVENDAREDLYILFSKIMVQKLLLMGCQIDFKQKEQKNVDKYSIAEELYKLSKYRHQWMLRKLVLTDRIQSFKGEKCTFQIKNIKEVWTRFEIFQKCLVIKLRHGIEKTQLAIPIVNYSIKYIKSNWLYRIYKLITSAI